MIHNENRAHETRGGASGYILGVASFLFCLVIGGVECGESTGRRKHNRSIRERYTALLVHVLRRERNRGHEEGESIHMGSCAYIYSTPCIQRQERSQIFYAFIWL